MLALTAWETPDTYTRPVPEEARITVPTLPLNTMLPVLAQPSTLSGEKLHSQGCRTVVSTNRRCRAVHMCQYAQSLSAARL